MYVFDFVCLCPNFVCPLKLKMVLGQKKYCKCHKSWLCVINHEKGKFTNQRTGLH